MTNTNPETGIRYGTIYLNNLNQDVASELWMDGTNVSEADAMKDLQKEVEAEAEGLEEEAYIAMMEVDPNRPDFDSALEAAIEAAYDRLGYDSREDFVEREVEDRSDFQIEEPCIEGVKDGVTYAISHLGGAGLLWIFGSPYIGRFTLCSPCCPGAVSLESPNPEGYEGYDVPSDWRVKD